MQLAESGQVHTPVKPTMFEINVGAVVQNVGFPGCFKLYSPVKPTIFEINVGAIVQRVGFSRDFRSYTHRLN